ncbi:MAG: hypothetical protein M1827_003504 [Pycnora praestabilis]|nr:MAG: hypothetical protein M1827_003504 [Pycnora praestabilis]
MAKPGDAPTSPEEQNQGLKRKAKATAGDWFEEHQTQKIKLTTTSQSPEKQISRRGSDQPQPSRPSASRTSSVSDLSSVRSGGNPYARREYSDHERRSSPPLRSCTAPDPESPAIHPDRLASIHSKSKNVEGQTGGNRRSSLQSGYIDQRSPPPPRWRDRPEGPDQYHSSESSYTPQNTQYEKIKLGTYTQSDENQLSTGPRGGIPSTDPRRIGRKSSDTHSKWDAGPEGPALIMRTQDIESNLIPSTAASSAYPHTELSELTGVLVDFTKHVTAAASINIQRDAAQRQLTKKEDEYGKSHKFHASFPPLAEQQENSKARAQKEFIELDKKLSQHVGAQEKLAETIAMRMIMSNKNNAWSGDQGPPLETIRRLEKELEVAKSEVHAAANRMTVETNILKGEFWQIKNMSKKQMELRYRLDDLERRSPSIELLSKAERLVDQGDEIHNVRMDADNAGKNVTSLSTKVGEQEKQLNELKSIVEGDEGDRGSHGLLFIVAQLEESVERDRKALAKANEDLNDFESQLLKFDSRIVALGAREVQGRAPQDSAPVSLPPAAPETTYDDSDIRLALQTVKNEVSTLGGDISDTTANLNALRSEQDTKDELVATEFEDLKGVTIKFQSEVLDVRQTIDASIARIDKSISTLHSGFAALRAKDTPTQSPSIPQTNGFPKPSSEETQRIREALMSNRQILEQQRLVIRQQGAQMEVFERACQNLDTRFNSLTTEHLARNMIHQMQEMYPYASTAQAEIAQMREWYQQLQTQMYAVKEQQKELLAQIKLLGDPNSKTVNGIQEHGASETGGEHRDAARSKKNVEQINAKYENLVQRDTDLATQLGKVHSRVENLWENSTDQLGSLFVQVERLNEHCGLLSAPAEPDDDDPDDQLPAALPMKEAAPANNGSQEHVEMLEEAGLVQPRKRRKRGKRWEINEEEEDSEYVDEG